MTIIRVIATIVIAIIALATVLFSLHRNEENHNFITILQTITFVGIIVTIFLWTMPNPHTVEAKEQTESVTENMTENTVESTVTDELVSDNGITYVIGQHINVNSTQWDVAIHEYDGFHEIAYYLVLHDTIFLYTTTNNQHYDNYAMTITYTPWTIEDIEVMDGIEITDYLQ